jgi:hypothetical protein
MLEVSIWIDSLHVSITHCFAPIYFLKSVMILPPSFLTVKNKMNRLIKRQLIFRKNVRPLSIRQFADLRFQLELFV